MGVDRGPPFLVLSSLFFSLSLLFIFFHLSVLQRVSRVWATSFSLNLINGRGSCKCRSFQQRDSRPPLYRSKLNRRKDLSIVLYIFPTYSNSFATAKKILCYRKLLTADVKGTIHVRTTVV